MTTYIKSSATVESETGSLKLARIGWHTRARSLTPSASTEATGYPAIAARNDDTFEFWRPTAVPAWWKVDLGSAQSINYCGIAAHNFGTAGTTVKVQYSSNDSSWSDASDASAAPATAAPSDDGEMLFLFPAQSARYWRIYVDGAIPTVGVIYLGSILVMQRGLYAGHSPVTLARQSAIRPTVSERGKLLGRTVIRSGLQTTFQWDHLTGDWYRANFDPFVASARRYPFFISWRPSEFPAELAFGSVDDDIVPSNSGPRNLMSVGFRFHGAGYA